MQTKPCLAQVGPEFPFNPPPPQCRALVVLLAFPGSTGLIPTAVRKAGCPHPSTATLACLPSTSCSLPAHSCTVCHPNAPTTHTLPGQASVYQSRWVQWLQLGPGSGLIHRLWLPMGSWASHHLLVAVSLSASGFPWGQFWGFPLMLLLSRRKQELGPPWGGMKGPLGPPHSACLCVAPALGLA